MPLDPNIAMSFQPAQVPTVNALINQSAQGMQNILATERQREADQMVRQDREAASLARALAPAMAAAFSDPSDAGLDAALSLVPEQYRGSMAAQVDQLRGIADPNRRKDVMRSALLQDEIGQALLAQLEPTANARLNADMAAQRAALDQRKLQIEEEKLAAAGEVSPDVAARLKFEREKLAADTAETGRKETAAEVKARLDKEKRAKDIDFAIKQVETAAAEDGHLDQATGSYFGNLIDTTAQAVGYGTEGAIANARMKPIADLVLKLVPRFEGPQAIPDVQSYKEAAGDLANPNLPTSVKKAAAAEIVRLLREYPGQLEYAGENTDRGNAGGEEGAATLPEGATTSNW